MKKSILFAGGIALALGFGGCDDGSAKVAELQAQLDAANQQKQVALDSLSLANQTAVEGLSATYQYQVDSLQYVIDSLTAPKGTTTTKPKPKPKPTAPTTTTTTTPKTEEPNVTKGGSTSTGVTKGGTTVGDTSAKKGSTVTKGGKQVNP